MTPHAISTGPGRWVDVTAVDLAHVSIDDIALSLSRRARFGGFTRTFYSVAQHSWNVAVHLRMFGATPTVQLQGLLHDAQEAYLGDIATPHKPLFQGFAELEERVQSDVFSALGAPWPVDSKVHAVDHFMLHLEAGELLPRPVPAWVRCEGLTSSAVDLTPWTEVKARHKFLDLWHALRRDCA